MKEVMKQMGLSQEEISASRVIIEKTDKSKIVVENPSVIKIKMQGQESFQITGEAKEEEEKFSEEDIQTIIKKTSCTKEQAKKMLEQTGDLAEAILELSS